MATSTILFHLRRKACHLSSISLQFISRRHIITNSTFPQPTTIPLPSPYHRPPHPTPPIFNSLAAFNLSHSHSFSTPSSHDVLNTKSDELDNSLDFNDGSEILAEELSCGGCSGQGSILPVRLLISLLDGFHDFTGWPWWVVIASSTLALRIALLPILILQLRKLKRIAESISKLPPPLPPPLSGRSYIGQLFISQKERRAIGRPYLWSLAAVTVQVPCFLLSMTCIRRMSLDNHPGFDCGGTLWFQNLTEIPHGVLGLVIPLMISSVHLINVKISFLGTSVGKDIELLALLTKCYKAYLYLMTLPIFFTGTCIPQGSLVYWLTNSSLTVIQQLSLTHPAVQEKLGLPLHSASVAEAETTKLDTPELKLLNPPTQLPKVSIDNLLPKELLALSAKYLSDGQNDEEKAIPLIKLALEKDPDYTRALILMGQILLRKELPEEAIEYLERAISRLEHVSFLAKVENHDLLILASQYAGVACIQQNKHHQGIVHLQRIEDMVEPEDSKGKAYFFDGLLLLSSALCYEGRKDEAVKHLRRAAAYNPSHKQYLEQIENEEDCVNDLISSRRGDY